MYKLILEEPNGTRWAFEGYCGEHPIFCLEHEAQPKLMNATDTRREGQKHLSKEHKVLAEMC